MSKKTNKLSLTSRLSYGFLALPLSFAGLAYYVYLPKLYADAFSVELALLGLWVIATRLFDAFSDPIIGALSDRTRSRFGRRRIWIAASVLPFALFFFLLANPLSSLSPSIHFLILSVLFFISWTAISVPYEALAPELVEDYDERTSLVGWREFFQLIGTLLCGIAFFVLVGESGKVSQEIFSMVAIGVGLFLLLALIPLMNGCVERFSARADDLSFSVKRSFAAFGDLLLKSVPLRVLSASFFIQGVGAALPSALILFYVERVLFRPDASLVLTAYLLAAAVGFPIWIFLAKQFEKKNVFIWASLLNTGAFIGVLSLDVGDFSAYVTLVLLSGLGLGGTLILPASMLADVTDYEELRSGARREGEISGLWSLCRKIPAALGAGAGLYLLGLFGFEQYGPQPASAIVALKVLYAGVASACNLFAVVVILWYPISRERHTEILNQLVEDRT